MTESAEIHVVAAAIVRHGLLLAARRSAPARLAGGWEFPGGKVEADEDEAAALVRECHEELGVDVSVGPRLAEVTGDGVRIVLFGAELIGGEPEPLEDHDLLHWVAIDEFHTLPWLPIDYQLLASAAQYVRERIRQASM